MKKTFALMLGLLLSSVAVYADEAQSQIKQIINRTYDKPDAKVSFGPVVIEQNYAIADWLQGKNGGRALLKMGQDGQWKIELCAGAGLKSAEHLQHIGLSAATAKALSLKLAEKEQALPVETLKRFDLFGSGHAH